MYRGGGRETEFSPLCLQEVSREEVKVILSLGDVNPKY